MREAGLVFKGRISRPRFWDSLSPMNYPFASRKIWAAKSRKEQPTLDYAANLLDPSVVERLTASDMKPRYNPAPLKPFRPVLVPPPVKAKKANHPKGVKPPKAGKKAAEPSRGDDAPPSAA